MSYDLISEAEVRTQCRSLLVAKLKDLKNLQELELPIDVGDEMDQNLVEAICHSISSGPLKTLRINSSGFDDVYEEPQGDSEEKDKQSGFFLPILDAVAASGLKDFWLPDCFNLAEEYRDRMIEILQRNTSLTSVTIGNFSWCDKGSLKHKKALSDKALIDHYTRLNMFGRGVMRDPKTTLRTIVDLLDLLTTSRYRDCIISSSHGPGRRESRHMNAQSTVQTLNGLLWEAPGKWSNQALNEDKNKGKLSAKSPPNRKRKASHSLDRSTSLGEQALL